MSDDQQTFDVFKSGPYVLPAVSSTLLLFFQVLPFVISLLKYASQYLGI